MCNFENVAHRTLGKSGVTWQQQIQKRHLAIIVDQPCKYLSNRLNLLRIFPFRTKNSLKSVNLDVTKTLFCLFHHIRTTLGEKKNSELQTKNNNNNEVITYMYLIQIYKGNQKGNYIALM